MTEAPTDSGREEADYDEELLRRLRRRDKSALAELSERFGQYLVRTAYLHLGDAHMAADAVQEALIAAWDGAYRTGKETSLRPWLFGILINRCRKISRKDQRQRVREKESAERTDRAFDPSPEEVEMAQEWLGKLRKAIARLDAPLREVVILRFERNFGVRDAAAALGIPEGTVKSRTHAAIAKLRAELESEA